MVEVVPAPVERELAGVPVRARNLGSGSGARRWSGRLGEGRRCADGARRSRACSAETVDAFVDLAGLGAGQYNLRVQVDPRSTSGSDEITPAVVDVTIRAIK